MITSALSSFSGYWRDTYGVVKQPILIAPGGPATNLPSAFKYFGERSSGHAGLVTSIPYTVGYMAIAAAISERQNIVTIRNKAGNFISGEVRDTVRS